jgi:hypothetical protein
LSQRTETAPEILILGPRTANLGFYFAADGGMPSRKLMNDSWHPYPFQGSPPVSRPGGWVLKDAAN